SSWRRGASFSRRRRSAARCAASRLRVRKRLTRSSSLYERPFGAPFTGLELGALLDGHSDEAHALEEVFDAGAHELRLLAAHVRVSASLGVRFDLAALTEVRVDDHGAVVTPVNPIRVVAVPLHRPNHPFELPGRGGRARIEEVPGEVDLERRVRVASDHVLVTGEVHELV